MKTRKRRGGGYIGDAFNYTTTAARNAITRVKQRVGHSFSKPTTNEADLRHQYRPKISSPFTLRKLPRKLFNTVKKALAYVSNRGNIKWDDLIYDDNGNLTVQKPRKYQFRAEDRTEQFKAESVTIPYTKDEKEQILKYIQKQLLKKFSPPSVRYRDGFSIPEEGKFIVLRGSQQWWNDNGSINIGLSGKGEIKPIWFINSLTAKLADNRREENAAEFLNRYAGNYYEWEYLEDISFQTKNTILHLPTAKIIEFLQTNTRYGVVQNQNELFQLLDFKESMKNVKKDVTSVRKALTHGNVPTELAPNVLSFLHPVRRKTSATPKIKVNIEDASDDESDDDLDKVDG